MELRKNERYWQVRHVGSHMVLKRNKYELGTIIKSDLKLHRLSADLYEKAFQSQLYFFSISVPPHLLMTFQ